ncbi:MAG: type II secretion system protein GspG [Nitrospirae bacterium]|nr:type II secretion system protein GspG [Nitrospirota bacterium]
MDSFPALKLLLSIIEKDAVEPKEITPIVSASTPQGTKAVRIASVFSFARMGIVIAFIGAFLISVIPIFSEKNDAVYRLKAAEDVIGLRFEINAYRYEHGSYPSAIEHIKKITDPWGNIYIYKTEGNSFVLFSTGPDGKKGTADDIH